MKMKNGGLKGTVSLKETGEPLHQEPAPQKLIYCESGRIGPYFPDFSANRTTMHLQIEKIRPRFPAFSLRSFLPRRLPGNGVDHRGWPEHPQRWLSAAELQSNNRTMRERAAKNRPFWGLGDCKVSTPRWATRLSLFQSPLHVSGKWRARRDSNPRPTDSKSGALSS